MTRRYNICKGCPKLWESRTALLHLACSFGYRTVWVPVPVTEYEELVLPEDCLRQLEHIILTQEKEN